MSPRQNEICPNCDSVLPVGALQCPGCGRRVSFTAVPYDSGEYSRFHFLRKLGPVGKVIIVIAVAAVPTLLVFLGYNYFWTAAIESNPYPTTPQAAVQQFFSSLQQEANSDFQGCYNLIHSKHKSQAAVVKSNRTDFIDHFRRIRDYLGFTRQNEIRRWFYFAGHLRRLYHPDPRFYSRQRNRGRKPLCHPGHQRIPLPQSAPRLHGNYPAGQSNERPDG